MQFSGFRGDCKHGFAGVFGLASPEHPRTLQNFVTTDYQRVGLLRDRGRTPYCLVMSVLILSETTPERFSEHFRICVILKKVYTLF